jgi:hypothetical protein
MFGETVVASPEPTAVIFADGEGQGTIDFVEWQTSHPFELTRFRLGAAADFCTSDLRTFDSFRLLAFKDGDFQEVFAFEVAVPYVYDFGCDPLTSRGVLLSRAVTPVTSDIFRAEFRQHLAPGGGSGVRVVELDGYTSSRCGDATDDKGITASDALLALRMAVGASTCETCICDITGDALVSATDALVILKLAVGQQIAEHCSSCFPPASPK